MIVAIIIGLLALFSLISFALDTDDGRQRELTRREEVIFWMRYGGH
jgi:type II secretory pathway pseudopilin PulG